MVQNIKLGRGRPVKVRIPQQFECMGHTIRIVLLPSKELDKVAEQSVDGFYDHAQKIIYLDDSLSYSYLEETFQHEKAHCILFHMGEDELATNEQFVELMAQVLYQIDKTSRGVLQKLPYRKGVRTPEGTRESRQVKQ